MRNDYDYHICPQHVRRHSVNGGPLYRVLMIERTDVMTASRVDLTLILLPAIGWLAASCMLAANQVPLDVAVRVLVLPLERRN